MNIAPRSENMIAPHALRQAVRAPAQRPGLPTTPQSEGPDVQTETLYASLKRTLWSSQAGDDPLARCLCALALKYLPLRPAQEIAESLPNQPGGLDLVAFMNAMAHLGYRANRLRDNLRRIDPRLAPCLVLVGKRSDLTTAPSDPMVLTYGRDVAGNLQRMLYSGTGGTTEVIEEDDPVLDLRSDVIVFTPIETRDDLLDKERGLGWFRRLCGRFGQPVGMLMLIGVALNVTALTAPLFIMLVYDRVVGPKSAEPLGFLIAGVAIMLVSEGMLRSIRSKCLAWLTSRMDYLVGVALFEKLLQLPARMIEQSTVASHIARIKTFESIRDFFCGPVLISALELPATLLSIAVIALLGGPIVLVCLIAALAYIPIFLILWRKLSIAIQQAALESSSAQQFNLEMLQRQESIRIDGLSRHWAEKHRELSGREISAQYRVYILGVMGELAGSGITGLAALATLGMGAQLIWNGTMGAGELIAVMMLTWRVLAPFHSLCSLIPRFEQSRNSILQIDRFMALDTEDDETPEAVRMPKLMGEVTLSSVALRHNAAAGPVFMGLSVNVKPGEIVAISGPNGSGKSSVLKLLLGMHRPLMGAVRLDGFDIRQISGHDLRRRIAYVPQDVVLFEGTIAQNLRVGAQLADDEDLWQALEAAGAANQVKRLPDGLDTNLDPNFEALVGEVLVQRIGFARAFLRDVSLVLIDEQPGSALRAGLDRDLKRFLDDSRGRRTVFFVSHRIDLIREADRAIALRPGAAPVVGTPDKVLELGI